jgi:hypothetical protein
MPGPPSPTGREIALAQLAALEAIQVDIAALGALVVAQTNAVLASAEMHERSANYDRFSIESRQGVTPESTGIWDGTDRYTP